MTCSVQDCDSAVLAKGMCRLHYSRVKRTGTPHLERRAPICSVQGCSAKHAAGGYCQRHYMRVWSYGEPGPVESTRRYKPDRVVSPRDGYARVRVPAHPRADKAGMVLEHIVVLEKKLGRPVDWAIGEQVHHVNGVKDDNRPENLELWVTSQPRGQRPEDLVTWALQILSRYGEGSNALVGTPVRRT